MKAGYNCTLLPHVYASDSNPSLDDRFVLRLIHNHLDATIKERLNYMKEEFLSKVFQKLYQS